MPASGFGPADPQLDVAPVRGPVLDPAPRARRAQQRVPDAEPDRVGAQVHVGGLPRDGLVIRRGGSSPRPLSLAGRHERGGVTGGQGHRTIRRSRRAPGSRRFASSSLPPLKTTALGPLGARSRAASIAGTVPVPRTDRGVDTRRGLRQRRPRPRIPGEARATRAVPAPPWRRPRQLLPGRGVRRGHGHRRRRVRLLR